MPRVMVVAVGSRWAVRREGAPVAFARFEARDDALEYGQMLADACGTEVLVVPPDRAGAGSSAGARVSG